MLGALKGPLRPIFLGVTAGEGVKKQGKRLVLNAWILTILLIQDLI
jgi:hypothetical protein